MPTTLQELVSRINSGPDGEVERAVLHRRRLAVATHILARALVRIFAKKRGAAEEYRLMARTALEQSKWWLRCQKCHENLLAAERRNNRPPEYEI